jgi:beta-glucanase (GH16 family)
MFGRHAAPSYSELDILEYVGCDKNIIYTTVHTTATLSEWVPKSTASKVVGDVETAFHVYGMNWEDEKIEFYLDSPDNVYLTFGKPAQKGADYWPFDSDEYLILNLAVGGDWGGMRGIDNSIWPQSMEVDYVRVFQK